MLTKSNKKILPGIILILILGVASFLRFYRLKELLGFWYDQGRDGLIIWNMIYDHKLTLIGPEMGFTGIFRGGWYYYLITPFYALGRGNPLYPSAFLVITTLLAIYLLFRVGKGLGGVKTGLMAALITSVSIYLIKSSQWLSDPTPTLFISVLLLWSMYKFSEGKRWGLILSAFLSGMALQFSAAAEVFYIPAIILLVFIFRKKVKIKFREIILTVISFIIPFFPQLLFELRHPGVQSSAFINFLFHEKTFTYAFWEIVKTRLPFDYQMFASKFWINGEVLFAPFFALFIILIIISWKRFWKLDKFKILFVLSLAPFVGTLFFVSNLGGVYEYYFTGYYLLWILLLSYVYMAFSGKFLVKIATFLFLAVLVFQNMNEYKKTYSVSLDDPKLIAYANQLKAVDWVYEKANGREFNVDEYVPPVIPYAYQYLFRWLGTTKYGGLPQDNQVALLYTLYEVDLSHPERLQAWLDRQKGIGIVLKEERFGGIVVQERQRIEK